MKFYAEALRCFMLDFLDLETQCAVSNNAAVQHAVHRAAKTNITSVMGSRVTVDKPYCHQLLGKPGGRVCMVHSVRGEEVAGSNPGVSWGFAEQQVSAGCDWSFWGGQGAGLPLQQCRMTAFTLCFVVHCCALLCLSLCLFLTIAGAVPSGCAAGQCSHKGGHFPGQLG